LSEFSNWPESMKHGHWGWFERIYLAPWSCVDNFSFRWWRRYLEPKSWAGMPNSGQVLSHLKFNLLYKLILQYRFSMCIHENYGILYAVKMQKKIIVRCGIFETETNLFHAVFVSKIAIAMKETLFFSWNYELTKRQGWNSQNFFMEIRKIFVTLRCFYEAVVNRKYVIYVFYSSWDQPLRVCASKTLFNLKNINILRSKVTKIFRICQSFVNFDPGPYPLHCIVIFYRPRIVWSNNQGWRLDGSHLPDPLSEWRGWPPRGSEARQAVGPKYRNSVINVITG